MESFEVILLLFFVSNPMKKRVERLGYDVSFNPSGDGDCFYASAPKVLGIETQGLKKVRVRFRVSREGRHTSLYSVRKVRFTEFLILVLYYLSVCYVLSNPGFKKLCAPSLSHVATSRFVHCLDCNDSSFVCGTCKQYFSHLDM